MNIRISVRNLVEFILRSGDIDERHGQGGGVEAMLEGARIHRAIQGAAGSDYAAEISMKEDIPLRDDLTLTIEGRADGIIEQDGHTTIDEIKGMYIEVEQLEKPLEVHLAQAKCYAYIWAKQNGLSEISVRMTYVGIENRHIRYFNEDYAFSGLSEWFDELVELYRPWAEYKADWEVRCEGSIHSLEFPYDYRPGQKELASDVYRTIYHGKKLFMEAPTGSGKTLATLFPGIKAMGEGLISNIFYLTAKNIGARAAADTLDLMRDGGLCLKSVQIIGRERACINAAAPVKCNPEQCEYAKGHFDRVNAVLYELLTSKDSFTRESIAEAASKGMVCPYALTRDLTEYADCIICDYNYVFDPSVSLTHFFGEGKTGGSYLFLIDEAHNLVDRAREIYSAELDMAELRHIKSLMKGRDRRINSLMNSLIAQLSLLEDEYTDRGGKYALYTDIPGVINAAERLTGRFMELLQMRPSPLDGAPDEIIEFYFKISGFTDICARLDERYRIYTERTYVGYRGKGENGSEHASGFRLRLLCVDPSGNLSEYFSKGRATVFFSATLLPVTYYMDLLAGNRDDYSVYASSIFDPDKLRVYINPEVTSRYTRRNSTEYRKIARSIYQVISCKGGNYMVFFPSYSFMENVYAGFSEYFDEEKAESLNINCICQTPDMTERDREEFLLSFEESGNNVGFCVLGGLFAEGIDLAGEKLIGAIIVGTGLPQISNERDILKAYFDEKDNNGFDYAMKIPGMNKVLQAAGRVIRTENDTGVIVLLDDRFERADHKQMFPREWKNISIITGETYKIIKDFWDKNNDKITEVSE